MKVLVTGGTGYIGAHVVRALDERGHVPFILDDLSKSKAARAGKFPLERVTLSDVQGVVDVFRRRKPDAVVHLAGLISVAGSLAESERYWNVNLGGGASLLVGAQALGRRVKKFVFSSTANVYGRGGTRNVAITDSTKPEPLTPYGQSKLAFERLLHESAPVIGMRSTALRYFNAAGSHLPWGVGEAHDPCEHILPRAIRLLSKGEPVTVYGTDYPTPDGTCIRDYIHVRDLADAHVALLESNDVATGKSFNVATGRGCSVLELVNRVAAELGVKPRIEKLPRRPGDPAVLIARPSPSLKKLGWRPRHDLADIVASAVAWEMR